MIYTIVLYILFININKIKIKFNFGFKEFFQNNILNFTLWNHFNDAITFMIYKIDTFVLAFFVSIEEVATYTVALTLSNYFFIIPQIGEKVLKISYSNMRIGSNDEKKLYSKGTFVLNAISILQFIFFIIFGKFFVRFLFPTTNIVKVYQLSALIILGITILNLARPISAILAIRVDLKSLFKNVYLPAGIIAILIYLSFGCFYKAYGVAAGNIASYLIFALLIAFYRYRNYKIE